MSYSLRFVVSVGVLLGAAVFLQAHGSNEILPLRQPLVTLPYTLGRWRGVDLPISRETTDVLGAGDFLSRAYTDESVHRSDIDLFMAYFASQRTGDTIHSPAHCLQGSGWSPEQSDRVRLTLPGHEPFWANRYLVANGDKRALVLYWFWAHDRAVASEYWAKFYLVTDSIRMNRSDGALVRIITPLRDGESADAAQLRLVAFAGELVPLIHVYVPR